MSLNQGRRGVANPGLSKRVPSRNGVGTGRCAVESAITARLRKPEPGPAIDGDHLGDGCLPARRLERRRCYDTTCGVEVGGFRQRVAPGLSRLRLKPFDRRRSTTHDAPPSELADARSDRIAGYHAPVGVVSWGLLVNTTGGCPCGTPITPELCGRRGPCWICRSGGVVE